MFLSSANGGYPRCWISRRGQSHVGKIVDIGYAILAGDMVARQGGMAIDRFARDSDCCLGAVFLVAELSSQYGVGVLFFWSHLRHDWIWRFGVAIGMAIVRPDRRVDRNLDVRTVGQFFLCHCKQDFSRQ